MKKTVLVVAICCLMSITYAQNRPLYPVGVGEKLGGIELQSYQGESFKITDYNGKKNILLVFPRGLVTPTIWCPICFYQYAELVDIAEKYDLSKKYDLEILYVLPYPNDSIALWHAAAEKGLATIERWKYPAGYDTLTGPVRDWADYSLEFFPGTYRLNGQKLSIPIPILMDEDKKVSRGMFLFTQEWGGTKAPQNIPTVFLINKEGKVVFKYHSQYTNDRPPAKHLMDAMKYFLK